MMNVVGDRLRISQKMLKRVDIANTLFEWMKSLDYVASKDEIMAKRVMLEGVDTRSDDEAGDGGA